MATDNIVVTVVDVGQGQCTFVEIYDDTDLVKPKHTLLFDCGSYKKSFVINPNSTRTIITLVNIHKLAQIISSMNKPAIDCIFLSHRDGDHINLALTLLKAIIKLKPGLTPKELVKKVWYAGYRSGKYKETIDKIEKNYCKSSDFINSKTKCWSSFEPKENKLKDPLWESDDKEVKVFCLIANVMAATPEADKNEVKDTKDAELKNSVSMVCGLFYSGSSYVICGDATNMTMARIGLLYKGSKLFDKNIMTTLPHHGSRPSGLAIANNKEPTDNAIEVLKTFADILKSNTLTVSAFEKYSHPSLDLINYFVPLDTHHKGTDNRLNEAGAHRLSAFLDIEGLEVKSTFKVVMNSNITFDTISNVFSTRYSGLFSIYKFTVGKKELFNSEGVKNGHTAINEFACWKYKDTGSDTFTIQGHADLSVEVPFTNLITLFKSSASDTPEDAEDIGTAPASEVIKAETLTVKQPARNLPQFHNRLKQLR